MKIDLLTSTFVNLRTRLKARALMILHDESDADDALQDAFCRLWSAKNEVDTQHHAQGLAMKVVRNSSIDILRDNAGRGDSVDIDHLAETADDSPANPEYEAVYDKVNLLIGKSLSARDQEILRKREMYGYEYEELAEQYGLTTDNVRAIVSRARKTIRQKYRETKK